MQFDNGDNGATKGVGIDMSTVSRFKKMDENIMNAFAKKILSENEYRNYVASKKKSLLLAECFSVKEAVSKAFGTGMKDIDSADIELEKNAHGQPFVKLGGKALQIAEDKGITDVKISITHEEGTVAVIAIAQ